MKPVEEDTITTRKELRPIHGILSLHGRKQARNWTCLVCSTTQSSIEQACSTCNRDRVPSWLLDINGRALLPGSVVRCPSDAATYVPSPAPVEPTESLSPPRPTSKSKLTPPPIGRGTAAPCVSPRATLVTPGANTNRSPSGRGGRTPSPSRRPISPRAKASPTLHSTNKSGMLTTPRANRDSAAQFTSTDERNGRKSRVATNKTVAASPRGKKHSPPGNALPANSRPPGGSKKGGGGHQKSFEASSARAKAVFEGQSREDRVVMVVAVNGVRPRPPLAARSLEGFCLVEGDDGKSLSASLVKVVLDMTKGHKLEVINQNLQQEEYRKFLDFGVCGRCNRTYRIVDGGRHVLPTSVKADTAAEVTHLEHLLDKAEKRKQALKAMGDYDATAEATNALRSLRDKIARNRRFLEPIVMSCPFCLWNGGALFATATTNGDEGTSPMQAANNSSAAQRGN